MPGRVAPGASYRQPSDGRQALQRRRLHSVKPACANTAKLRVT
jgi:hypothetical protein